MGLRDWVSEKGKARGARYHRHGGRFNGAPRLGLGEGGNRAGLPVLQSPWASLGLRDWVSEKASRPTLCPTSEASFNGAPRLGLGEGRVTGAFRVDPALLQWGSETGSRRRDARGGVGAAGRRELQWGSETGSRRRDGLRAYAVGAPGASMGLRDWVSEKDASVLRGDRVARASMGLRDWVSEKGHQGRNPG